MTTNYMRDVQLAARYGVHRMALWRWLNEDPTFPRPIRLSARCTRWKASDIEEWEAAKQAAAK